MGSDFTDRRFPGNTGARIRQFHRDFSKWLSRLHTLKVIVKMDIEGAELPILEKVIEDGTDDRISLLLLEWHDWMFDESYGGRRTEVEASLRCPVEVWH